MKKVAIVIACLLYVVSPIDFIPDLIPILGQIDDLGAIMFSARALFGKS